MSTSFRKIFVWISVTPIGVMKRNLQQFNCPALTLGLIEVENGEKHSKIMDMTTQCQSCGFNNPPGMRFCGNCGSRLSEITAEPVAQQVSPRTDGLGVMMGSDLLERMRRAGLEAAGQRRNVTVLFADLSGYTALSANVDSEDLYEFVQQYIRLLSNNVYKYEGFVDKFTGDGIMALFGAPISHENNAERAVRAALDMQNDLTQLNQDLKKRLGTDIQARIGLHSGSVIVGGIGSNMLMNYTAIGDTVNLARRIEEAAPSGAILISEAVYRQVRMFFDCQQISVLNPKGIAHPVVAYRVVDFKARPASPRGIEGLHAPMIGRDQELWALKDTVAKLIETRQGQFTLITGEAGLGKSRLIAELKASLDLSAVRVLEGQSLAYRRTISYWIIREILYSYLGLHPSTTSVSQLSERLGRYVYQLMGDMSGDVLPYLENLLSLPFSDLLTAERIKHLDARQLRQQTFLAVRDLLLLEAYKRPLVILMDDLHWADEASLDLLHFLLESVPQSPIFIVAISRGILQGQLENAAVWGEKNLGDRFQHIPLQSLSLDQSDRLLQMLLLIPELPAQFHQQVLQRAAGIPFYLEEILRMMIDNHILLSENGQWRVHPEADFVSLGVPETLQELIMARFDRLTNTQRRVLQVAAVIGKDFSLPVLHGVMQSLEVQALRLTVDSLVEREFILPQSGNLDTEYTFRHVLMSDVIYSTILKKERRQLHGQVGEMLETLYSERIEDQVELLANHYRWSSRLDKALQYLVLAGKKAMRNYSNEQARLHYETALEVLPQVDHLPYDELQVYMGLGDVLAFIGEYPEARQKYQKSLRAIGTQESSQYAEECSSLYRKIARTYERSGDYEQALAHLHQAIGCLEISPLTHSEEQAEIWHDIGWIHFRRGNFVEAEQYLGRALELVESTNAYGVIASIHNRLAGIAMNQGDWDRAVRYLQKSISIRGTIGDLVGLASSTNNLGYLEIEMGEFDSALENLTRNYDLVKRLGQVEGIAIALSNLGWLHILRGEPEEADQALSQSLEMARQIDYKSLIREVLKNIGELHLSQQHWLEAQQVLSDVAPSFEELGAQDQLLYIYRLLGEAALGEGNLQKALGWAEKLDEVVARFGDEELPALQRGELLRFQGMLAIHQQDWPAAQQALQTSEAIFKKLRSRLYLGKTIYQIGILAQAQGDRSAAQAHFSEAYNLFHTIGAKLEARRAELACSMLAPE
jgi:predicted ATPase/class 3 adenylate cyclase